jgi:hypothetical protein
MQTALSLFANGSRPSGGLANGLDLGSILGLMGGAGDTPDASLTGTAEKNEKPFDLEAFLASLSESGPSDRGQTASNEDAPPKVEPSGEKEANAVLLPELPKKRNGHPPHSDTALLLALRPYLNADRRAMIDNILRIGRFMDTFRQLNTRDGSL